MDPAAEDLPEAAKHALCRLLDDVPDEKVLAFARGRPDLLAGVRAARGSVGIIRERMRAGLLRGRAPDAPLRDLLANNSLQMGLAVVLSEEALGAGFAGFATWFAGSHFAAALLLDERPGVRRLARDHFLDAGDAPAPPTAEERERAGSELRETFAPFLGHIAELAPDGAAAENGKADAARETRRLSAELNEAREELKREQRRAARVEKATTRELEGMRGRNASLEQELAATRERARAVAEEKRSAEADAAELRLHFEQRVGERLETELSARVRPWLTPVEALEESARTAALAAGDGSDVLARAGEALTRQAALDRHFGNRAGLQRRLAALEAARTELVQARRDALNPLPELDALAADLEREIHATRIALALPPATGGLEETVVRINAVRSLDELDAFRQFLDTAADLQAWSPADQRTLYGKLDQQFSRLMEPHLAAGTRARVAPAPLAALRRALARDEDILLLVDGHNLLPAFFTPLYEAGRPGARARKGLTDELVRMFAGCTRARAMLYFDSDDPTRSEPSAQVVVLFSGGSGRDRADDAILSDLERDAKTSAATTRFLVSSDAELVRQARELGALTLRSAEFAVLLAGTGE